MEMNWQEILFSFVGGLGVFLFSIKYMGDALQKAAGDKLRDILDRFTTNPFMGVLVGIIVTILIQSSTGTTVIVVGLVSAGFMTLRQAIGVIMGANIGTTVTAFIIGLDVGAYALPIMAIGAFMIFFFKKNQVQNIGQVIFGFGGLFFGMETMSGAMKPLRDLPAFIDMTVNLSEFPILGVAVGTLVTFIVQSSSGTVAILQGLYGEGLVTLDAALPILFGDNIGTTVTAVLAALGTSIAARRAAAVHVLFNLIGSIIFIILLVPFTAYVEWISALLDLEARMQIAFAHGTFNIANTIIQFPLIGAWAYLVTKIIPGDEVLVEFKPKHLDLNFIEQSPSIALGQAKEEILRMGKYSVQGLEETYEYLKTKNKKNAEMGYQLEDAINNLDSKITDYLVLISAESISAADSTRHTMLMETVRDIERIGDHFENIIELIDYQETNKVKLTAEAMEDLDEMFTLTIATVSKSLDALDTTSHELAREVAEQEDLIDKMERKFRKKHILRLNEGACSAQAGIVFVDIVSNLERVGDHSVNIAEAILGNRA
ncbi:Na/Pi cotransporter family protein [Planococcus sp. ISL-109]|uniref:Na/Pi cotransporter family protein n=1 Tax=Planococcus sp. ISL-109 TaxID=2819166 RepID=UPI001BE753EC|nr:Na/Pi cotransporter family protein [Planococcus sp. ISL-109]